MRASVRAPVPLRFGQGGLQRDACGSFGGLSAASARPGIRLGEAPTLRPAPRPPLPPPPSPSRAGTSPGSRRLHRAPDPAGATGKGAGVGAALTFFGGPGQGSQGLTVVGKTGDRQVEGTRSYLPHPQALPPCSLVTAELSSLLGRPSFLPFSQAQSLRPPCSRPGLSTMSASEFWKLASLPTNTASSMQ